MRLFVDTSAWCSLYDRRDAEHERTAAFWRQLPRQQVRLFTTDYVFSESVTLLRARVGHHAAVFFGERILQSAVVQLVEVSSTWRQEAWALFKRYADKEFSFVDCTSFVVMRSLDIREALTLDGHFRQMGFTVYPLEP